MSIGTILLIVLVLILVGALPSWPHSRSWGYGPTGIVGVLLVILVVLLVMGRIYRRSREGWHSVSSSAGPSIWCRG